MQINNKAASSTLGQGTHLLARMDQMYFENSLPSEYQEYREKLFDALLRKNSAEVSSLLYRLNELIELPNDTEHPIVETAKRILKYADRSQAFEVIDNQQETSNVKNIIKCGIAHHDYSTLLDYVKKVERN